MKEFIKKHLRPCRKVTDQFVLGFIVVFLLVLIGQLIGEALTNFIKNSFFPGGSTPDFIETGLMYGSFIGIWIVLILVMLLPKNRPMLKTLGRKFSGNNLKMSLFGLLLGFGMNAICVAISILNHDVALYFYDFNIGVFLLLFVAVFIQSAAEELAMRSYYYEKLRRRYRNPILSFIFTAVGFSLMHVFNPNMTAWGLLQIVLIGIQFAALVHYYNSLWCAFWVHASWNFTQSILFGLPNSGLVVPYSVFKVDAASTGFFFDAGNGVEGSPGACIVVGIVTILLIVYAKKKNLKPHDLWSEQEAEADALLTEKSANS